VNVSNITAGTITASSTITAPTFSGTATYATYIASNGTANNQNFYLLSASTSTTANDSTYKSGHFYYNPSSGTLTSTSFNATSDLRLKDNINDLSNSLEKICAIRGVEYTWKGDDTKKLQSGVIAQEVNMIIPEAVNTSDPDTLTVNYNAIIGHLIEAVKTLKQEVDTLKSQLPRV
jgi:hypothetical protein